LKSVCSWCGLVIHVGSTIDATVTHTICPKCIGRIERQMDERQQSQQPRDQHQKQRKLRRMAVWAQVSILWLRSACTWR
jgi:predicted RNA-binding Zn-ribbon protein involved in translation (DUF1610 family)